MKILTPFESLPQEANLPGHTFLQYLREKLQDALWGMRLYLNHGDAETPDDTGE